MFVEIKKEKIHVFDARKISVYHLGRMIPAYSSWSVDQGVNSQNSPLCYPHLSQIALPLEIYSLGCPCPQNIVVGNLSGQVCLLGICLLSLSIAS